MTGEDPTPQLDPIPTKASLTRELTWLRDSLNIDDIANKHNAHASIQQRIARLQQHIRLAKHQGIDIANIEAEVQTEYRRFIQLCHPHTTTF